MALDTNISSPTYDAYSTIVDMDAIMTRIKLLKGDNGDWGTLDDPTKEIFILEATKFVDGMTWNGDLNPVVVAPQRTQPRIGFEYGNGTPVDGAVVAPEIKSLMGCWIVGTMNDASNSSVNSAGIKKKKVGDVEIEYLTSDKSGSFIADTDSCAGKLIPFDWYISDVTLGGIGTIGLTRIP